MPAKSKSQQRLMGQAYAIKKGDMKLTDVDPEYKETIKGLVDGMTLKQLKDFAETKHKGLPNKVGENIEPGSIPGMGSVEFPGNPNTLNSFSTQETGSGDIPFPIPKPIKKKKKMKYVLTFESFINI